MHVSWLWPLAEQSAASTIVPADTRLQEATLGLVMIQKASGGQGVSALHLKAPLLFFCSPAGGRRRSEAEGVGETTEGGRERR